MSDHGVGPLSTQVISWTAEQLAFQVWLSTPGPDRVPPQQRELMPILGVAEETLSRWKRLPGFMEAVNDLARAQLKRALPSIYAALIAGARAGSFQHIELALKMTGDYDPKATLRVEGTDKMNVLLQRALAPWALEVAQSDVARSEEKENGEK